MELQFQGSLLVFLKCTLGISYSSHKSVEFMHSCNTVYGLMVHCFKNSRCEIMINIMRVFCLIYWSREGSGACLPTLYSTFNVLVRASDKGWLMSSSLLLKIRVALQSGDRKHTINLRKMSSQITTHQKWNLHTLTLTVSLARTQTRRMVQVFNFLWGRGFGVKSSRNLDAKAGI